jgi:cysteine protease ATG4
MAAAPLGGNNALSSSQTSSENSGAYRPPEFYADLTSRVWITHRSHFHWHLIPDSSLTALEREKAEEVAAESQRRYPPVLRQIAGGRAARRDASDAGWGCMLRTGHSLLATVFVHLHLGRGT